MRRPPASPSSSNRGGPGPPRDPRPRDFPSQIVLITSGLALYVAVLWLGVAIIRDTPERSAVMAGLIVGIAAVGYAFTHRPMPPGGR